jgi:hypothetical protein
MQTHKLNLIDLSKTIFCVDNMTNPSKARQVACKTFAGCRIRNVENIYLPKISQILEAILLNQLRF